MRGEDSYQSISESYQQALSTKTYEPDFVSDHSFVDSSVNTSSSSEESSVPQHVEIDDEVVPLAMDMPATYFPDESQGEAWTSPKRNLGDEVADASLHVSGLKSHVNTLGSESESTSSSESYTPIDTSNTSTGFPEYDESIHTLSVVLDVAMPLEKSVNSYENLFSDSVSSADHGSDSFESVPSATQSTGNQSQLDMHAAEVAHESSDSFLHVDFRILEAGTESQEYEHVNSDTSQMERDSGSNENDASQTTGASEFDELEPSSYSVENVSKSSASASSSFFSDFTEPQSGDGADRLLYDEDSAQELTVSSPQPTALVQSDILSSFAHEVQEQSSEITGAITATNAGFHQGIPESNISTPQKTSTSSSTISFLNTPFQSVEGPQGGTESITVLSPSTANVAAATPQGFLFTVSPSSQIHANDDIYTFHDVSFHTNQLYSSPEQISILDAPSVYDNRTAATGKIASLGPEAEQLSKSERAMTSERSPQVLERTLANVASPWPDYAESVESAALAEEEDESSSSVEHDSSSIEVTSATELGTAVPSPPSTSFSTSSLQQGRIECNEELMEILPSSSSSPILSPTAASRTRSTFSPDAASPYHEVVNEPISSGVFSPTSSIHSTTPLLSRESKGSSALYTPSKESFTSAHTSEISTATSSPLVSSSAASVASPSSPVSVPSSRGRARHLYIPDHSSPSFLSSTSSTVSSFLGSTGTSLSTSSAPTAAKSSPRPSRLPTPCPSSRPSPYSSPFFNKSTSGNKLDFSSPESTRSSDTHISPSTIELLSAPAAVTSPSNHTPVQLVSASTQTQPSTHSPVEVSPSSTSSLSSASTISEQFVTPSIRLGFLGEAQRIPVRDARSPSPTSTPQSESPYSRAIFEATSRSPSSIGSPPKGRHGRTKSSAPLPSRIPPSVLIRPGERPVRKAGSLPAFYRIRAEELAREKERKEQEIIMQREREIIQLEEIKVLEELSDSGEIKEFDRAIGFPALARLGYTKSSTGVQLNLKRRTSIDTATTATTLARRSSVTSFSSAKSNSSSSSRKPHRPWK